MNRKLIIFLTLFGTGFSWGSFAAGTVTELGSDDTSTFAGSPDCYPDLRLHVSGLVCEEQDEPEGGHFFLRFRKPAGGAVDVAHLAEHSSSRLCGGDGAYQWLTWDQRRAPVQSAGGVVEDTVYFEARVRCVWLDGRMEQLQRDGHQ